MGLPLAALCGAVACWSQGPTILNLDPTGRLTFAEVAGAGGYQVEWTPSLDAAWTNTGLWHAPTDSGTVSVALSPPAIHTAFYRVAAVIVTNPPVPAGMVYIPAGSFQMGDSFTEGDTDERPVHTVSVSAFYMDKYEVTKAKWDEVHSWATAHGYTFNNAGSGKAATHPVHTVSWYDVVKWCNARSQKEDLTPCYTVGGAVYTNGMSAPDCNWSANGYRLPTEAEWEKAARGGAAERRFPWADTDLIQHARANYYSSTSYAYDTSPTRGSHPTYATGDYPYTSPVGSFAANGYGLYDMAGNVWEWCWDWYLWSYYSSTPGTDPRGPTTGSPRVIRGGSWYVSARACRSAFRGVNDPSAGGDDLGFRSVRPPGQ